MTAGAERRLTIGARLVHAAGHDESSLVVHRRDDVRTVQVAELRDLAAVRRGELDLRGVAPSNRVGIIGPTEVEFVAWSYAVWLAGATLVLLPSPLRVRDADALREQTRSLTDAFECGLVIAHPRLADYVSTGNVARWDEIDAAAEPNATDAANEDELAVILCTSGSTSTPKGVGLTHRRLLAQNIARTIANPTKKATSQTLTFAPVSHGTGLSAMLGVLSRGRASHIMAPELFARDPAEWLRIAQRIEATSITGPSSAWAAALTAAERRPEGIDLSRIERAALSMEMVDPDVVEQLISRGGRLGLRREAIAAVYALSEGGATSTAPGEGIHIDVVDLDELADRGVAVPATDVTAHVKRVAGCGRPVEGVELRVMGTGGQVADRVVGDIQFRGTWAMDGYVGRAAEDVFVDGWMRTGDLGYLVDGELFLTGRVKELIIHMGRNYHPEDVEQAAAAGAGAGITPNECVAFSPTAGSEGEVVVVVECDHPTADLEERVRTAVTSRLGLVLSAIVLVPRGTLPKAANGKQQRLATRDRYESGALATPDTGAAVASVEHPSGVTHYGEFVTSAGEQLYVASYLPRKKALVSVVVCPSWGVETARHGGWTHRFAHDLAARGAAVALVQWPGTEDSEGDPTALTLGRMVEAGLDAAAVLRSRSDQQRQCVVGLRVGAAPAALLAAATNATSLVLVQPGLDLPAHFAELERQSRRGRLGAVQPPDWAFGHPSPRGLRSDDDRDRVLDAVRSFGPRATVVRYRKPADLGVPAGARHVRVWGEWTSSAAVEHVSLRTTTVRSILRSARRRG